MSRPVPTCGKCDSRHWNFQPCEQASAERAGPKQPPVQWQPEEGLRPFGNRMENFDLLGGHTLVLKEQTDAA
jgi:hypothetical protein